ncbi:hypothetical protein [Burkholderia sp. BCC1999]|uniref:hypothetical protein n=1 Tax=Burkholderia sp. BCC1999 TaxID=2817448 RepID=UPI002AC3298F|nr:hypothetical protein [Burkholderia sp. BCC1999]
MAFIAPSVEKSTFCRFGFATRADALAVSRLARFAMFVEPGRRIPRPRVGLRDSRLDAGRTRVRVSRHIDIEIDSLSITRDFRTLKA